MMEPIQASNPQVGNTPRNPRPMLSFGEALRNCWKKFANFKGRARRSEYWWWVLFCTIISGVVKYVDGIFGFTISIHRASFPTLTTLVWLILIIPSLAVKTRRLHDTGHSGWWVVALCVLTVIMKNLSFIFTKVYPEYHISTGYSILIYSLGLLTLLVVCATFYFTVLDSHRGENKYGRSPKYQ